MASSPTIDLSPKGKPGSSESCANLLCVGFGLRSLSVATALADSDPTVRVSFHERRQAFSWEAANVLSDNKIRTPFLRDLVTTRDPRSRFTFINYLYSTNQLVAYTNASALNPSKLVMSQYLAWVAQQIEALGWVSYGEEVVRIEPVRDQTAKKISSFAVTLKTVATGERSTMTAKRVIVSTGCSVRIPQPLSGPELAPHVLHARSCSQLLAHHDVSLPDVAIVGASQEGAELYEHLNRKSGNHRATFFIEDSALRPDDDTPFTQNLADCPSPDLAAFPPELRQLMIRGRRPHPGRQISLDLLERLYDMDYAQGILEKDALKHRFHVEPLAKIVGTEIVRAPTGPRVRLWLQNPRTGDKRLSERSFDLVVASEYSAKPAAELLLAPLAPLLDKGADMTVDRDYRINFGRQASLGRGVGLWWLDALAEHEAQEDVFLYLAEQGKRVVESAAALSREEQSQQTQRLDHVSML